MASHLSCLVTLNFVIDGLEDDLTFYCISTDNEIIQYLKKILFGEVKWRSKYCSEIFYYVDFDDSSYLINSYDSVESNDRKSDKICLLSYNISENCNNNNNDNDIIYLISYDKYENGCSLGFSIGQFQLFQKIICPNSYHRLIDIYCTFSDLNVNNSNDVVINDLNS